MAEPSLTAASEPVDGTASGLSDLLDAANLEFLRLQQRGETVDVEGFCARYPSIRSSLARRLQYHQFLEENPHLLEDGAERWPKPGDNYRGFHLMCPLGQGAFSRVFLARQAAIGDRCVVLKLTELGGGEAHTLGRMNHPNVAAIHSIDHDPPRGLTLLCMPYFGEATLRDIVGHIQSQGLMPSHSDVFLEVAAGEIAKRFAEDRTPPPDILVRGSYVEGVCHIAIQILDALAYLHEKGVIHCDLKPSNILLTPAGKPMLLDFNLSADVRRGDADLGGTLPYMAPEQLQAMLDTRDAAKPNPVLDARADLFAFGIILYELLTGRHPFAPLPTQGTPADLCQQFLDRQRQTIQPLRALNPTVDRALARLVDQCLARAVHDRPDSAQAAAALLYPRVGRVQRAWAMAARRPKTFAAVLLLAFALTAAVLLTWSAFFVSTELERGQAAYREARYEEAVFHLGRALEAAPNDATTWFARGLAFARLGASDARNYLQAASNFEAAWKLDPQPKTIAWLGYCMQRRSNPREAAHFYTMALDGGFESPELLNNLGAAELETQGADLAMKHLSRALTINPFQAAYHNRSLACLHLARLAAQRTSPGGTPEPAKNGRSSESLLRDGIADAQRALAVGPPSGELYYDAAQLCAVAARSDREWIKVGLEYLDQALAHGIAPAKLSDVVWSALRQETTFRQMQQRQHTPYPMAKATRLLPPTDE
jgi:serine/threonine protein kinase/Tfp pilus assembly protein PilF